MSLLKKSNTISNNIVSTKTRQPKLKSVKRNIPSYYNRFEFSGSKYENKKITELRNLAKQRGIKPEGDKRKSITYIKALEKYDQQHQGGDRMSRQPTQQMQQQQMRQQQMQQQQMQQMRQQQMQQQQMRQQQMRQQRRGVPKMKPAPTVEDFRREQIERYNREQIERNKLKEQEAEKYSQNRPDLPSSFRPKLVRPQGVRHLSEDENTKLKVKQHIQRTRRRKEAQERAEQKREERKKQQEAVEIDAKNNNNDNRKNLEEMLNNFKKTLKDETTINPGEMPEDILKYELTNVEDKGYFGKKVETNNRYARMLTEMSDKVKELIKNKNYLDPLQQNYITEFEHPGYTCFGAAAGDWYCGEKRELNFSHVKKFLENCRHLVNSQYEDPKLRLKDNIFKDINQGIKREEKLEEKLAEEKTKKIINMWKSSIKIKNKNKQLEEMEKYEAELKKSFQTQMRKNHINIEKMKEEMEEKCEQKLEKLRKQALKQIAKLKKKNERIKQGILE